MMRISSFLAWSALACGAAFGASRAETATYVDGNLTGVSPNTGGTLVLSDEAAMYFRAGLVTVPVTYASIGKAELGAIQVHSHDVPLYKVWALHKRFTGKTETQLLTVEFKTEEGEDRTMTLELAQPAAAGVLSQIESLTPKGTVVAGEPVAVKHTKARKHQAEAKAAPPAKPAEEWWGDSFWKTARNADKWNKAAAAPDQK